MWLSARIILNRLYSLLMKIRFQSFGPLSKLDFPATINNGKSISVGNKVHIREHAWLNCIPQPTGKISLTIGSGSYLGRFIHINAYESVEIENDVLISDRVFISDVHHAFQDQNTPIISQGVTKPKPIKIKSGCWIGINACIMPGVSIGKNAIVAANSVVTRDVPDFSIARGVPAQIYPIPYQEIKNQRITS